MLDSNLLNKIYILYSNDFYATIGYDQKEIDYKITIKDNEIYINGNNIEFIQNRYLDLENKIISFADKLFEYFTYIEDEDLYYKVVPNDDLDCDSITSLSDKLKNTNEILLFEIPYMEEISMIIDIIEPTIIKEYQKAQKELHNSLSNIIVPEYEEELIYISSKKVNKYKTRSWKEQEFEREADLWGLSKEDRRMPKKKECHQQCIF